jgi:hypothetical protein
MDAREWVTPGALYRLLNDRFRRLRPPECQGCLTPLPCWSDTTDPAVANWRIGAPSSCPHQCDLLVARIAAELSRKYDLFDPISMWFRERESNPHGVATAGF